MKLLITLAVVFSIALLPFRASAQAESPESPASTADQEQRYAELQSLIELLQERLQKDPENANDWLMLARSYVYMQQPAKAAEAFGKARQQFGDSPELLTSEAEYLMLAADGKLDEETEALVKKALEMRPNFGRALWLAGIAHYQRSEYEQAGRYWQQLRAQVPAGSESEKMVQKALDDLSDRGVPISPQKTEPEGH